ncbi:glycosyltransferase [Limosilactobacillus ingluviei]|uniref:glycosyltransferase n=1 Tax=Limosilactobacillus ingluviei TaxID=148604 RepID=UPI0024B9E8D8|nr:glycosyltransferase [Limosilactobacillus ingluviei]
MKITFVLLHYKNHLDTIECINSILKLAFSKSIVIVDNASKDGSIDIVKDNFKKSNNLFFIENENNLGFAEGNNIGYKFAREKLNSDYIIVGNNDLIFDQTNFIQQIDKTYQANEVELIGPDIESLQDHGHQNPMTGTSRKLLKINVELMRYRFLLLLSKCHLYDALKRRKNSVSSLPRELQKNAQRNVVLHGSIIIFTPKYVQNESKAFRPGTFLYMEEDILYLYAQSKRYTTLYEPTLHVYHKEDSSTNKAFGNNKKKREFVFKNMIKSIKVYRRYLMEYNKSKTSDQQN